MIAKVYATKDENGWFVDDNNGFSREENSFVAGIPEIIEAFVGNYNHAEVVYGDESFEGATALHMINSSSSGTTYCGIINGEEFEGWLCPVFFHYFKSAPKTLYINISENN